MSLYIFENENKEFALKNDNCLELVNDDEKPVEGFDVEETINLLANSRKDVDFENEFYQEACPSCMNGVKEKQKFFKFLEYHFYIYTNKGKYVISDISKDYEGKSFNKLSRAGEVDDSYIVSVIVCDNCSDYIIQIENCIV